MTFLVAVGSKNPVKVRGVERAFRRYFDARIEPVEVSSPSPQPVGREVVYGALARSLEALRKLRGSLMGVGVEAGPIEFYNGNGFLETQVAVIVDRECRVSMGVSSSFELPDSVLELVIKGVELSKAVEYEGEEDLGEGIGYIGLLSWGKITRLELTEQAVTMALIPRIAGYRLYSVRDVASRLSVDIRCP